MGRIRQITAVLGRLGEGGVPDARDHLAALVESQAAELDRLRGRLTEVEEERDAQRRLIADLTARVDALEPAREHMTRWLEDHNRGLSDLVSAQHGLEEGLAAVRTAAEHAENWLTGHSTALDGLHVRTDELERAEAVRVFTEWLDQAELAAAPRISVVLPTHNRAALLPKAVESVRAQRYPNWELVIVDDASTDDTPEVIAALTDPRIRSVRTEHGRACAARNTGLAEATGEIIAYLDDDNTMHPLWLKAVAWAFAKNPEVNTAYGGFVIDATDRADRVGLPLLVLTPYSRERLLEENLADMGALAHRADHPAAHFDESLRQMGDWDLLLSLTADRDPLVIPAVACYYSTGASNRLSQGPHYQVDSAAIRAKHTPSP
ncbi:glycosyltransferase family 2 protein [Actinokineospora iranica]|uniref:glycosyltransferase family 2 protein n=1 Tax=Actinokineospora iranica TaxID=1271860 RepID=UPI001E60F350|nr:glycosyltransferase family A protein [Actinokineospora iranica]